MSQSVSSPETHVPPYTIETWGVGRLKKYERNARLHSAKQVDQLRDSFRKFGQVWPILVREDGTIIAGHGRLEAAKAEGLTEVRVIVAAGWSEEQCRAFGVLDNKVALNSTWDEAILASELAELGGMGVDLGMLGFEPNELAALSATGGQTGLTDPDDVPDAPVVPVTASGDLWALGRHWLLCGDATSADDTQKVLGSVKPHLMVTDPPYGVNYSAGWRNAAMPAKNDPSRWKDGAGRAIGAVSNDDRADWSEAWSLFPGDVAYVWHAGLFAGVVADSLASVGFNLRSQIIWAKSNFAIGRGDYHWHHEPCWYVVRDGKTGHYEGNRKQTTLWQIDKPQKSETGHSTQKPVECMKRPIENNSSPGQAVYEPFSGSGHNHHRRRNDRPLVPRN